MQVHTGLELWPSQVSKLSQVVSGALHTRTGRLHVCLVVKPCGVWPGRVAKA